MHIVKRALPAGRLKTQILTEVDSDKERFSEVLHSKIGRNKDGKHFLCADRLTRDLRDPGTEETRRERKTLR